MIKLGRVASQGPYISEEAAIILWQFLRHNPEFKEDFKTMDNRALRLKWSVHKLDASSTDVEFPGPDFHIFKQSVKVYDSTKKMRTEASIKEEAKKRLSPVEQKAAEPNQDFIWIRVPRGTPAKEIMDEYVAKTKPKERRTNDIKILEQAFALATNGTDEEQAKELFVKLNFGVASFWPTYRRDQVRHIRKKAMRTPFKELVQKTYP